MSFKPEQKLEVFDLTNAMLPPGILEKVPVDLINKHHFVPIGIKDNILTAVFGEVPDEAAVNEIKTAVKYDIKLALAPKHTVRDYVKSIVEGKDTPYQQSSAGISETVIQVTRSQITRYKNFANEVLSTKKKLNYIIIGGIIFAVVFIAGLLIIPKMFSETEKEETMKSLAEQQNRLKMLEQDISTPKASLGETIYDNNHNAVVLIYIYDENGKRSSQGSGSIVRSDGVVLTNNHVVEGAHSIKITRDISSTNHANAQEEVEAEGIIFVDGENDLALVKIKRDNYPTVKIGDSDKIKNGEDIFVIGSPLHIILSQGKLNTMNTISKGVVSNQKDNKIQITAQISGGSSGGPVFNAKGELIAVVVSTIIYTPDINAQNINFAVPVNFIKDKIQLKKFTPAAEYFENAWDTDDGYCLRQGNRAMDAKRYDEAFEYFKQAVNINQDCADAHFKLGAFYLQMEPPDFQSAISSYKEVIRVQPENIDTHYWLGICYCNVNKLESARREYRALKKLDKDAAEQLLAVINKLDPEDEE
ncbi:MAG: trypsin-like peptidase domain-containing protein [Planctomycetes bacterium]|nr:trypsin-like peptidase domain-containing protein [Planctomycetota bacterium]